MNGVSWSFYKIAEKPAYRREGKKTAGEAYLIKSIKMKKIILLLLTATFLTSCNGYKSVTTKTWLDMNKQEFFSVVKYPSLELAYHGVEVYRTTKRVVRGGVAIHEIHFFYFKGNKLVKIDKGERAVDHRQQIDVNINQ